VLPTDDVPRRRYGDGMCRSIKTLRPPFTDDVTEQDMRAAALQYVRKVSGFRAPAAHNRDAFDRAVDEITASTLALLASLEVRGQG
jgi:hypothetical protein